MTRQRLTLLGLLAALLMLLVVGPGSPATNAMGQAASREMLTSSRTYFVRSDGSDGNTCLADSPGGACRTWQHAVDLAARLDFGGNNVTIQHGNEAAPVVFAERIAITTLVGGGNLHLRGSPTPGKTILRPAGGDVIALRSVVTSVQVWDMTLEGGDCLLMVAYLSTLNIRDGVVFGPASFTHILVHDPQVVVLDVNAATTIAGGGGYHYLINGGMLFLEYSSQTFVGNPGFYAYAGLINGGKLQSVGTTFSGASTGMRYSATGNSIIQGNLGPNYFPGTSPGIVSGGSLYQ